MKKKFNWDRFLDKNNNICVVCGTKESAIDFFKQKDKHTKQQNCNITYIDFLL